MSTYTSEPGTKLGGRYRLEDRLAAAGGWSAWKAIDEILARPVSVITFAAGFPRLDQVVTAARAASRLTDTRLTQVFDVEDSWDHAYIVLEWPVGETLADTLSAGPVDPLAGARIVAEAAAALAGAHAAGLAHLCLRPEAVRWTAGGGVKVTGLGIDAALSGTVADDPELADTRGLGQLLYAALTGTWPEPDDDSELPPAPRQDGHPRRPRQVLAGVPAFLDDVACQALALPGHAEPAFSAPAQLASALLTSLPPVQIPPAVTMPRDRREADSRGRPDRHGAPATTRPPDRRSAAATTRQPAMPAESARSGPGRAAYRGEDPDAWRGRPGSARGGQAAPGGRRRAGRVVAVVAVAILAVAGVSAAALHVLRKPASASQPGAKSSATTSPAASTTVITPVSASGFDALNPNGDPGDENSNQAANVLSGNPQGWATQYYDSAEFGDLKAGTGFILDLGTARRLTSVTVRFGSVPGANVQLKLGDSNTRSAANLDSMTTVARASDISGSRTFTITSKATGRYLVIWFTRLPPMARKTGRYEAQIFSVVIRGGS